MFFEMQEYKGRKMDKRNCPGEKKLDTVLRADQRLLLNNLILDIHKRMDGLGWGSGNRERETDFP